MTSRSIVSKGARPRLLRIALAAVLAVASLPALSYAEAEEVSPEQSVLQDAGDSAGSEGVAGEGHEGLDGEGSVNGTPNSENTGSENTNAEDGSGGAGTDPADNAEDPDEEAVPNTGLDTEIALAPTGDAAEPLEESAALLAAAPGTIVATITDDNGVVNLGGANDVAVMSYQQHQNHVSKIYDLKITLSDLDPTKTNVLTVNLPRGMRFNFNNINNFLAQAGQFALDVSAANYTNGGQLDGRIFGCGFNRFTLKTGVSATTVSIPITFDPYVNTDTITNAARVTLSDGTATTSETLEKVTRQTDDGCAILAEHTSSHPGSYWVFSDGDTLSLPDRCRQIKTLSNGNPYNTFITGGTFTLKLADPNSPSGVRAKIKNTDTTGEWAIISSNETTGEYVFRYTPAAGFSRTSVTVIPFEIEFPASASPAWTQNDPITITYVASGTFYNYLQFAEGDPAGNTGSSVSAATATQYLVADVAHNYRYQQPGEKVWVNYASNTDYLGSSFNLPAVNRSFAADISCADGNPANNDETGVLGYFMMGNAGAADSAPKTVEIHFDGATYGVMALFAPYRAGETLTQVEYTTTAQSSWTAATVNATANSYGQAYISYKSLGIASRTEFITGIRYKFGVVPAGKLYAQGGNTVDPGLQYFGKWLGANGNTASATMRVYDTDPSGTADTGVGTVTTNRISKNAIGYPTLPAVSVTAGQTMQFNASIGSSNNTSYRNATNENPVLYIRSEVKDEDGNPLPVTNITLSNNGRPAGQILPSELIITNWKADENGDGKDDVWIYKIDTKNVPTSKVCLLYAYINSNGALTTTDLNLSYQVATTALTPSQSYDVRDMVYVLDRDATSVTIASTHRHVTESAEPSIFNSLRNGEDWSKGILTAPSTYATETYKVNGIQSIIVTSQIKHLTGTSWTNYTSGGSPIPVGMAAGSGFQLKTNVVNNAGSTVTGTEVYIPLPKAGENWGSLVTSTPELSLMLKNKAAVSILDADNDPSTGAIGGYTVKYGIAVTPTDVGATLQGYTWLDAASVADWSQVNCVQIVATGIEDKADLEVILDVKADENQTNPALVEGLTDIWHPTYFQDLTSQSGVYKGWYAGGDFGVQAALSAIKGRLFNDLNNDGFYSGSSEDIAGANWKIKIYAASDPANALQEISFNADGTYAFYDLVSAGGDSYILEVVNPYNDSTGSPYYQFSRTATREGSSSTAPYVSWGANTFATNDDDATAAAANAYAQITGANASGYAPTDIPDEAVYNVGVVAKVATALTWRSADAAKGTVAGDSGSGLKTLSGLPSVALPAGAAPTVGALGGYTFTGWARVESGGAAPAWDAVPWKTAAEVLNSDFGSGNGTYGYDGYDYYAVFSGNPYILTFDKNAADATDGSPVSKQVTMGSEVGALPAVNSGAPTRPGYTFEGWSHTSGNNTVDFYATSIWNIAADGTVYAVWKAHTATPYTIEHYKVDADGVARLAHTEQKTGTTNTTATAIPKAYTGYTYVPGYVNGADQEALSGVITGSGGLVLKLYYAANPYTVSYNGNGGSGTAPGDQTVYYGQDFTTAANTFAKTGYAFAGWNTQADGRGIGYGVGQTSAYAIAGNSTLYAQWDPASGVAYTIEHYLVGSNGAPVLDYSESRTGITGSTVFAAARAYPGYYYNESYAGSAASGTVAADGSLVLKLYYSISSYQVRFVDWDGTALATRTVLYGAAATAPLPPSRIGHIFSGWDSEFGYITSDLTVTALYNPLVFTITFLNHDGAVIQSSTVAYGGSVSPPADPVRSGFRFTGWNQDSSAWINVTADATIRATFDDETTRIPVTTVTEAIGGSNTPSTPHSPDEEMAQAAREQNIPSIGVPLAAPSGYSAWALANLILAALGVLMALIFSVVRSLRRNEKDGEEREGRYGQEASSSQSATQDEGSKPLRHRRTIAWLIGALVFAIAGVVLFVLTEDTSLQMVWVDMWTLVQALLFIALLILGNIAIGRKKCDSRKEQDDRAVPAAASLTV